MGLGQAAPSREFVLPPAVAPLLILMDGLSFLASELQRRICYADENQKLHMMARRQSLYTTILVL